MGTNGTAAAPSAKLAMGADLPSDYGDPFDRPSKGRRSGVILHPTSLPGSYGIGELGQESLNFVNWLAEAGCSIWQVLPLVPPDKYGSPYSSTGASAGAHELGLTVMSCQKDCCAREEAGATSGLGCPASRLVLT